VRAPENQRALLILDNCEHVIKASAQMASAILKVAPQVRLLASSREPLHSPGEQCYPVLPLPVPARGDGLEALARSTAVRLFVDRAQLHKPSFVLTSAKPRCCRAGGPAGRHPPGARARRGADRSLSVADINARLKDRYKLLTGGSSVLQERQQNLRALVDWSYELLTPESRSCSTGSGCSSTASTWPRPRRFAEASRWPARTCSTCSDPWSRSPW
jgi:predicted ATPase